VNICKVRVHSPLSLCKVQKVNCPYSNDNAMVTSPKTVPEPHASWRLAALVPDGPAALPLPLVDPEGAPAGLPAVLDGDEPLEDPWFDPDGDDGDDDDPDDPDDPEDEPVTQLRLVTGLHLAAELADVSVALYGSHESAPDEESCTRAVVEAK